MASADTTVQFIYLFGADGGLYKIGRSKDPGRRLDDFAGLPFNIKLLHTIATDDPSWLEHNFHDRHQHCRVTKEWFKLTAAEVELFVRSPECIRGNLVGEVVPPPWIQEEVEALEEEVEEESPAQDGSITGQLRAAIRASGQNATELSKQSGLVLSQVTRFINGERGLSLVAFFKLCLALDLELRLVPRKSLKPKE